MTSPTYFFIKELDLFTQNYFEFLNFKEKINRFKNSGYHGFKIF